MLIVYKYRIYSSKKQEILINKHIDSARPTYNLALETKQLAYFGSKVNLSCYDPIKQLHDLKKDCGSLKNKQPDTTNTS